MKRLALLSLLCPLVFCASARALSIKQLARVTRAYSAAYPSPCLAVSGGGLAHVRVGKAAFERHPGGRFGGSRFSDKGNPPCGLAYSADGDLIVAYREFDYEDYRDGDVYKAGFKRLFAGAGGSRTLDEVESDDGGTRPQALIANAAGAAIVLTEGDRRLDAQVTRRHGRSYALRAVRWDHHNDWSTDDFTAAGTERGAAVLARLYTYEPIERFRVVVATRKQGGGFSRAVTLARSLPARMPVAVSGRGVVFAALQSRVGRVRIATGTLGGRVALHGRGFHGSGSALVADGADALLATTNCPRRGRCAVQARAVNPTGGVRTAQALGTVPRGTRINPVTGSGGRALVWWRERGRLRVSVRGADGFARPVTLASHVVGAAHLAWGRGHDLYGVWTVGRRAIAVALRVR